ncbi:hypothetical protein LMK05_07270 [Lactococcus petauri]|nr:hypothetical protein LMK05_07270 [Lactococcus petauri]
MFYKKKINNKNEKKNELRLKHYQSLTHNLLKNNILPLTPEEKINGVNKINKILISSVQQRIFERGVLKNDFSYNHYDHRYFFETSGVVPECPSCGEIESEENHHSLKNPIIFYPNADPLLSFPWNQSRIDTLQYIGFRTGHPLKIPPITTAPIFIQ